MTATPAESSEATTRRARRDGGASGRPGRNLYHAVGVGVALAALVLATLFLRKDWFVGIIAVAMVLATWEMRQALAQRRLDVPIVPLAVGSVSMIVAAHARGPEALVIALGLTLTALLLWRVADGIAGAAEDVGAGALVALYPSFLGGFAALLLAPQDGRNRVIVFILVTVCSDIGGYVAGVMFGRHPMAPRLSPKKSWEGFAGSVLFCAVTGAISVATLLSASWIGGAALGCVIAMCATLGDLMESSIKRDLGIKDMGNLLPGHGGFMDRLDSLLVCAPVAWVALILLAPTP